MMNYTDRHFRYLLRLISSNVMLYTEMISTGALLHGDAGKYLEFDPREHPLAVQLGGSNPDDLRRCTELAEHGGFDEINLNAGCPSGRVSNAGFGACLMARPDLTADCVAAIKDNTRLPVTIKMRTGIDDLDSYEYLVHFIERVSAVGCNTFIIHARKAWLQGLSPSQNRKIPPLQYERVHSIKREFPHLEIIINGGFNDPESIIAQYQHVDGVMIGRMAYNNPYQLARMDSTLFGDPHLPESRRSILRKYLLYMDRELSRGTSFSHMARHILSLFQGVAGARAYRRYLSENLHRGDSGVELITKAVKLVQAA